jgi:hypothetical protein
MPSRLVRLAALLLLLLVCSSAYAGELKRRITLLDGGVEEGWILERGEGYVVLQRDDGTAVELFLDAIDVIEVLTDGAPLPAAADPSPRERASAPAEPPRFDVDWADDADEADDLAAWKDRYDRASISTALSFSSTIPLLSVGLIELASGPMVVGGFNTPVRFGMGIAGGGMLLGSVAAGALGALEARRAVGVPRDLAPIRLGVGFGVAGTALYTTSIAFAHGIWAGEIAGQSGAEGPLIAVLVGMGIGGVILGDTLLLTDARQSRDRADDEVEARDRRRSSREAPALVAGWGAPIEGGFTAGVSGRW